MDARQRTTLLRGALVAAFALAVPLTGTAQPPPQPPGTPLEPYTPADGAKDLRSVLFNWTRNMGMLKGTDEREMVATLEYQGTGTIQVGGQPCTVSKLRTSTNYQTFSQRNQYTCTRGGQTYSNIEVVSGLYAWDEDAPGATIAGTPGTVTPKQDTVQERLIRLWASPQGAPKAAIAATSDTYWLGANPGTLLEDGPSKVGQTSVEWRGDKAVVTFPLLGIPGAIATATLTPIFLTESVVVRQGSTTTEFTYSDYKDWNNELILIEVLYAG